MTKKILNFFLILISFNLTCCVSNSEKTQIRIVDLQGKFKPVLTKVPDFNAQILNQQNNPKITENKATQEQKSTTIIPDNQQNIASDISKQISQTTDSPVTNPKNKISDSNFKNNDKSNMIFAGRQDERKVDEYDLANSRDEEVYKSKADLRNKYNKAKTKEASLDIKIKKYFVQTGSYVSKQVAEEELVSMKKFHKGKIEEIENSERKMYRVLIGPFVKKMEARKLLNKIVNSGHDAILVKGS